jgi:hypothetical protein
LPNEDYLKQIAHLPHLHPCQNPSLCDFWTDAVKRKLYFS